jgi:hypothetical protein
VEERGGERRSFGLDQAPLSGSLPAGGEREKKKPLCMRNAYIGSPDFLGTTASKEEFCPAPRAYALELKSARG